MITLAIEYTLHTDSKSEFMQDSVTIEKDMRPSQVEKHMQERWAIIRDQDVTVTDLLVTKVTHFEPVEHKPEDRYHFKYSA